MLRKIINQCVSEKLLPPVPTSVAVCAVFCALLPVHPSIQAFWVVLGLPSAVGAAFLFGLVLLHLIRRPGFSKSEVEIFLPFFVYIGWMVITTVYSPAVGMANWWNSIRGLAVILPVMLMVACVAARNPQAAAMSILSCALVAALHYLFLLIAGVAGGNDPGKFFGAIAVVNQTPNYQSTAFYIGIVAVFALSLVGYCKRYLLFGGVVFLITVALLGTTGARSPLVALLVLTLILLAMSGLRVFGFAVLIALGAALFVVSLMALLSSEAYHDVVQKVPVVHRFTVLFSDLDSSQRLYLFGSAVKMWLHSLSSVFIGGGLAAYPIFIGRTNEPGWYPHNFILESLAEGGVIAVLPLGYLLFKLINAVVAGGKIDINQIFLRNFALYSCFVYMFTGGVAGVWLPFFALGLYLFANANLKHCSD